MATIPIPKIMLGAAGIFGISAIGVGTIASNSTFKEHVPKCRIIFISSERTDFLSETTFEALKSGDYGSKLTSEVEEACISSGIAFLRKVSDWSVTYKKEEQDYIRKQLKL